MSATKASDQYACGVCTYIQSNAVKKCEICGTANPSRSKEAHVHDFTDTHQDMATCPQCKMITIGIQIRVCEYCGFNFADHSQPKRKFRLPSHDNEDSRSEHSKKDSRATATASKSDKPIDAVEQAMSDDELKSYYETYMKLALEQRKSKLKTSLRDLQHLIDKLYNSLQYKNEQSDGQLIFSSCQICFENDVKLITMKACGHRMICTDDFHHYLSTRIRDADLHPWVPCPAEVCNVPCAAQNIVEDGHLTPEETLAFITAYMSKKISRNENFISCGHCSQGGFLQFGPGKKEHVKCSLCGTKQTIEKGFDGELDPAFKKMVQTGQLRECPTCHLLTMKEKGLCNVIECTKCGIWWNWRTREQGHSEKDLKQRARMSGTLWEPGELSYQQNLERNNPEEFKALLERNGIKYNPNYVRGGWNES